MSVVGSTDGPDDAELQVGGVARLTAQQGIQAIIAPMIEQGASEEEIKATVARARQFYYEHKYVAATDAEHSRKALRHPLRQLLRRKGTQKLSRRRLSQWSSTPRPSTRLSS